MKWSIKSWQQLEKATNKTCSVLSPSGPSDSTKEISLSGPCYAAEQDLFGPVCLPARDASCPKSTFSSCKGRWGTPRVPTLCVSEVRGEEVLTASDFGHSLVGISSGFLRWKRKGQFKANKHEFTPRLQWALGGLIRELAHFLTRQNFSLWHEIQLIAEGSGATTPLS